MVKWRSPVQSWLSAWGYPMKLTDAKIDEKLEIVQIYKNGYEQRLSAMGMIEGCEICPLRNNNGTLLVDVLGCRYALGKEISECIVVKPL